MYLRKCCSPIVTLCLCLFLGIQDVSRKEHSQIGWGSLGQGMAVLVGRGGLVGEHKMLLHHCLYTYGQLEG